ncbi:MAG: arabinofuranosyltransferase [Phycisphaerales bacterium]|nr:arabinofuranosyltransferase [Phycisphaerales bacterium]
MQTVLATPARVAGQMAVAIAVTVLVAVVALVAIARVDWPAYNSSNQLHALTTVGQVGCLAGLLACGMLWRRQRQAIARLGAVTLLAAFSVVTLAMPLGATKLYLFGISVDQQFRTEYLTRLTDSPALHDMTYIGLPPFYPPGWFWIGGRLADLTGTPAWEMFKPWSIISIAIGIVLAFVLWANLIRFEYALVVSTATAAATLAYSPAEPYAAIIAVLLPPVFVLAWSGLRAGPRGGRQAAVVGVGVFLGVAALFYTLLLAYAAFTLTIMAALLALAHRRWNPLLRLLTIAGISGLIALIGWGPYLLAAARGTPDTREHAEPVRLEPLVDSILESIRPSVAEKGIDLQVRVDREAQWSIAPGSARIITRNIIENAADYTGRGGRISIEADRRGRLIVSNAPVSITPEHAGRVFEPFWRASRTPAENGHRGLGLSVVAAQCECCGLRCAAEATDAGAFVITIEPAAD